MGAVQEVIRIDKMGTQLGKLAFLIGGEALEEFLAGDQLQDGIAEKLKLLIVGGARALAGEGAVGERLLQQCAIGELVAESLFEIIQRKMFHRENLPKSGAPNHLPPDLAGPEESFSKCASNCSANWRTGVPGWEEATAFRTTTAAVLESPFWSSATAKRSQTMASVCSFSSAAARSYSLMAVTLSCFLNAAVARTSWAVPRSWVSAVANCSAVRLVGGAILPAFCRAPRASAVASARRSSRSRSSHACVRPDLAGGKQGDGVTGIVLESVRAISRALPGSLACW